MVDTALLREAISHFSYYSKPSSSNGADPATVKDIRNLAEQVEKVLNVFIKELEKR